MCVCFVGHLRGCLYKNNLCVSVLKATFEGVFFIRKVKRISIYMIFIENLDRYAEIIPEYSFIYIIKVKNCGCFLYI